MHTTSAKITHSFSSNPVGGGGTPPNQKNMVRLHRFDRFPGLSMRPPAGPTGRVKLSTDRTLTFQSSPRPTTPTTNIVNATTTAASLRTAGLLHLVIVLYLEWQLPQEPAQQKGKSRDRRRNHEHGLERRDKGR